MTTTVKLPMFIVNRFRRDIEDARHAGGMRVGLPTVTVDAGNLAGVLDRAEAIERDRDEARAALAAVATYFDEQLEVTDSPGTRQTLEIHRNIARRALTHA